MRRAHEWLVLALILVQLGCSGTTKTPATPPAQIAVSVMPTAANVRAGATQPFTASVTGTTNQNVTWSVNGVAGGNATSGTISGSGVYTAPASLPNSNAITIGAASAADSSASGTSNVTLWNATPAISSVTPTSFSRGRLYAYGDGQQFREWRASAVWRRGGQLRPLFQPRNSPRRVRNPARDYLPSA